MMRGSLCSIFLASAAVKTMAQYIQATTMASYGMVENQVFKGSVLLANTNLDTTGLEFLSADQANRQVAGFAAQDAATGRQRWKLIYGGAIGTDWYNIVSAYGTSGSYDYLGTTDPSQASVSAGLFAGDDGTGLQRWQLIKAPSSTNGTYYIRPYLAALTNTSLWLTQTYDIAGNKGISMVRLNATATPQAQWQLLQFSGEYNLISQNMYLSASSAQMNGRGLTATSSDTGSGQQRVQLLKRLDGLYYILVEGTASAYKYLSIMPGSQAQAILDVRQSLTSVTWNVQSSVSNTFTIQDARFGFYLTMPSSGSTQFLSTGYVQGSGMNWILQPTQGVPGGSCIQNVGNGQYLQGPLGSNWVLIRGPAATWYQVKSAASASTFSFLSLGVLGSGAPNLVAQDDGSGFQRWEFNVAPNGFYIQPWAAANVTGRYLAAQSGPVPLTMASQPDGSLLQTFVINSCPAGQTSYMAGGAIAAAVIFSLIGAGLLIGGAYYVYIRKYNLDIWMRPKTESDSTFTEGEPDLSAAEKGTDPVTFGNAFTDPSDIKIDMKDQPSRAPAPARSQCFPNCCLPGRGVAIIAA